MFGINSFLLVGQIVEGHYNEALSKNQSLSQQRLSICKKCPLYEETSVGPVCSGKKCFNTKTLQLTSYPGTDTICGCGCRLLAKTTLPKAKCVLNKW